MVNNTWLYEAIQVKCTHTHTLKFIGSTITAPPPSGFLAIILYAASRDQKQSSLRLQQSVRVDAKSGLNGWSRWWEDAWGNSFHSLCPYASRYDIRSPETDTQFQDSLFHNLIVLVLRSYSCMIFKHEQKLLLLFAQSQEKSKFILSLDSKHIRKLKIPFYQQMHSLLNI